MIKGFEKITEELSEEEILLIPYLIKGFQTKTKENPIKAPQIVKSMNTYLNLNQINLKFTEIKLRKCVNYIRANGLLPLIANSKGYYVSYDIEEIQNQIKSLQQRASSIMDASIGLINYINK